MCFVTKSLVREYSNMQTQSARSVNTVNMAIFHPGRWDRLFIWDSGLVRHQSVWLDSWDLGSLVPGSHRAGQLASSYERNNVFVWMIGIQQDLAQAGHPTYRAHMNRPLVFYILFMSYLHNLQLHISYLHFKILQA